ncbi:MAG: SdrD B-like domain-containing protein, partial [Pseudomonadota bacterium]|nr:SdrD B-like domain-containing protein [Pseudomonadota bacterium]
LDASNNVLLTTTTSATGGYLFSNLNAGDYKVEVVKPAGYFVTKQNATVDASDSDIGSSDGRTALITLSSGQNDTSADAGLYRKASIGDKVWFDTDKDGIQDVGEAGIAGIKVTLLNALSQTVATTTTDSSGNYKFSNLDPGSYSVQFDKTSVIYSGNNMSNYAWGAKNIGSNDSIDSDVIGDGVAKTNVTHTDVTVLVSGENDLSWDAAITPIVIDLNGDGIHTVSLANSAGTFDLLGNGGAIASGWISGSDGFLAVDRNGNGSIDSIGELFGGSAKGAGFAQLASFDSNGDGVVDARDADFASLLVWRDVNGNHQSDAGELVSLTQAGVLSLTVAHTDLPFVDAQGNLHLERSAATLSNGISVDMTDVYFAVAANDAPAADALNLAQLLAGPAAAVPDADAMVILTGARNPHEWGADPMNAVYG